MIVSSGRWLFRIRAGGLWILILLSCLANNYSRGHFDIKIWLSFAKATLEVSQPLY